MTMFQFWVSTGLVLILGIVLYIDSRSKKK